MNAIALVGEIVGASSIAASWVVFACAVADAALPQPGPGSRWVPLRRLVSTLGLNVGYAVNRIMAGSTEAAVTPLDIVQRLEANHEETLGSTEAIASTLGAVIAPIAGIEATTGQLPGKISDLYARVNNVGVMVAGIKAPPPVPQPAAPQPAAPQPVPAAPPAPAGPAS